MHFVSLFTFQCTGTQPERFGKKVCSPWKFLEICKLEHCVIRFMIREPEQEEKLILHLQGRKNPGLIVRSK